MSFFERLFGRSVQAERPDVTCSGCRKRIGAASKVKHSVEAGRAQVYFCETCHKQLIVNDERFDVARAKLKASGMFDEQEFGAPYKNCPICGQVADKDKMYGADLATDLDCKQHLVFSFLYHRPPRAGESGWAVQCMRKACPACANRILPGLSPQWMEDSVTYQWMKEYNVPF